MAVHRPAQVEQQVLRGLTDDGLHQMVGDIIDQHDRHESDHDGAQHRAIGQRQTALTAEGVVEHRAHQQRDRQLAEGEDQHGGDPKGDAPAIGRDIAKKTHHHPTVEGAAEQFLVLLDLRADHRQGRLRRGRSGGRRAHDVTSATCPPPTCRSCNLR